MLTSTQPFTTDGRWSLEHVFSSQHTGVVRCALWDDTVSSPGYFVRIPRALKHVQNGVILSGGEDSVINAWSCPYTASSDITAGEGMDVDLLPRKRGHGNGDFDVSDRVSATRDEADSELMTGTQENAKTLSNENFL